MTFATWPIAAIAAAVAIPTLLILYFLKLRRRDLEISSTLLWKKAIQDLQANAPFQRLRNNILLILQLLALIAALFALAQPEFKDKGSISARHIILIDRSASMSAEDGDATLAATSSPTTRLDAAKKEALNLVASLHEPSAFSLDAKPEEAMVIAFDTAAEVRQTFTSNKAALRAAIDAITPTDSPTSLARAFDLAKAYAGTKKFEDQVKETVGGKPAGFVPNAPPATMHLFSDGRLPDAEKIQAGQEDTIVYHAAGSPTAVNIGVTGLRAERSFDNPGRVNIFVGLQSTDPAPTARKVDVELSIDGTLSSVRDVSIAPAIPEITTDASTSDSSPQTPAAGPSFKPGLGGFVFPLDRPKGGIATVRLTTNPPTDADVLPTDNTAYLVIPPAKRLAVVLVTAGNLYLPQALESLKLSRTDVKTPAEFQTILDQGQAGQYDVFIFDRVLPTIKGDQNKKAPGLPPGRSLVLGAIPPPPLGAIDESGGKDGPPDVFLDFARDHPALRLAALDKVNIGKTKKVSIVPDTPVRAIARTKEGPAILEVTDPASQALIVCFDPTDTDWPFDPGYLLFLAGGIFHLSETQSGSGDSIRVGETLETRLPPGAGDAGIALPDGETIALEPAPDGAVTFGPITKIGVYTVSWKGIATARDVADGSRASRAIAANLLDPAESDLATRPVLSLANKEATALGADAKVTLTRRLWPWLMLLALAIVMFEWFIYNRKVAI